MAALMATCENPRCGMRIKGDTSAHAGFCSFGCQQAYQDEQDTRTLVWMAVTIVFGAILILIGSGLWHRG